MKKLCWSFAILIMVSFGMYAQTGSGSLQGASVFDSSNLYVQQIVSSKVPVLIDFWAVWCGPCKMLSPIIAEIEKEYKGKVKVFKVNVDRNRSLASYFKIVSIPNVYIIDNKIAVKNIPGLQSKDVYVAALQEVLNTKKASVDSLEQAGTK